MAREQSRLHPRAFVKAGAYLFHATLLALALLTLLAAPAAHAQYDRDGRYVPSPMGRPSDPYRSYIPGYTGKPGDAKRIAPTPRAFRTEPPLPNLPRFEAAPGSQRTRPSSSQPLPVVYPTRAQCAAGWSRDVNIPRARFARACRALNASQQTQ